jgi:restriction system protein
MSGEGAHRSDRSDESVGSSSSPRLRPSGGYRDLRSFQVATIIYDATVAFCERFIDSRSRLIDQMVQAARSGRQNIAEGSRAAATSSQTELRLVNVARASLDELLLDYEDFLRQRRQRQWGKEDPEAQAVRAVGRRGAGHPSDQPDLSDQPDYAPWLEHANPAVRANALICLIHQANYLLDQQVRALEAQFIEGGGYSEQLAAARIAHRRRKDLPDQSDRSDAPPAPTCQLCGQPMVLRTAKKGPNAGSQFWGCSGYPNCKSTQPV